MGLQLREEPDREGAGRLEDVPGEELLAVGR